jgi:hypothetical protein
VLTLTGVAPVADYLAVLRTITYDNTAATPIAPTIDRIVTFAANDGMVSSVVATATIKDPPLPTPVTAQVSAAASQTTTAVVETASQQAIKQPAASSSATSNAAVTKATSKSTSATIVRSGSKVVVTGTAADDTFEFVAGATENTLIVGGESYVFAATEVTTFQISGGGGNDIAKLTTTGLLALAESVELHPGSATLQGIGYTVEVADVQNVQVDGRGEAVQAALFDSAGDDLLTTDGDVVSLSGDGFLESVSGFKHVQASSLAGGHDSLRESVIDQLLEKIGNWTEDV